MRRLRPSSEHHTGHISEIPDRKALIVGVNGKSIGVFKVDDRVYAVKNVCPHRQAPLCRGTLGGNMLSTNEPGRFEYGLGGRVLKCPWHGWEFDIATGQCLFGVSDRRVKVYPVEVRDEQVSTCRREHLPHRMGRAKLRQRLRG